MSDLPPAAVEAAAEALDAMNCDGWIAVPDPRTGMPVQERLPLDYLASAALAAALPAITEHLRGVIADEIEAHANYAKQYEPDSKFLVGLETAVGLIREGSK